MTLNIDAHQHFWSLQRDDYGWLTPDLTPLFKTFGPEDLVPLLKNAGIKRTILVQAAESIEETRYLLNIATQHDFVAGVVGWIDMESPSACDELTALAEHPKFVGIRPMLQDVADPAWINRPSLTEATDCLVDANLCFDALVRSVHLPCLIEFLVRHPDLQTVIDHGAKPNIASDEWQPWADSISRVACETSAFCKISGLITEARPSQSYEDLVPYLDHLLKAFGPRRLMWGSDWPVLNLASEYAQWHAATAAWMSAMSKDERALIQGGNAARFYGLEGQQ